MPKAYWCFCDCGNTVLIAANSLRNNHTKSCGCLAKETTKELMSKYHTFNGLTLTRQEWADRLGITKETFERRLKQGLSGSGLFRM